ncbi:saccharopine dehydrogenase family protein [Chryseobacterium pennipullorum]|uniref:Saccharopine dehydrogenase n=1 Tax=Chryseobacterium pennipullorum TaxID=2258963 RepID=A0A3D9AS88_9FLAO|nr:saccharopine dehydrogenase [Chryseobacterium pennipullorum]REC44174.1 saccharopine dehydrogenase [Chryseobacterium pennipullorum]
MEYTILIIGGNGLVGKTITRILKSRNPNLTVFTGGRKGGKTDNDLRIDVTDPSTFQVISDKKIQFIILSVNDKSDHVLRFAIENGIDYLDITKPTPDLVKAYDFAVQSEINSRIVFSSGWMGGIVPALVNAVAHNTDDIQDVRLFVYYSVKDLAGESSAHFMAENVAVPFHHYKNNQAVPIRHFLNAETFDFSFGIGKRRAYHFDVPDLYIINRIERVPNVNVKMTYNSKFITWLLGAFQYVRIFNILSLKERKMIFGSSGNGDQSVFEILVKGQSGFRKLSLRSSKGQAELTALSAVLHTEELLRNSHEHTVYFSHQLHHPLSLLAQLSAYETINIHTS